MNKLIDLRLFFIELISKLLVLILKLILKLIILDIVAII